MIRWKSMLFLLLASILAMPQRTRADGMLQWRELPDFPNSLGVAGPFVGVHRDALIVAGGANFPQPVWDNDKQWVDDIHVLVHEDGQLVWRNGGKLPRPIAYGACVSTAAGVLCIGGNDAGQAYAECLMLSWNGESVEVTPVAPLPEPVTYAQAALVGSTCYLVCGQTGLGLDSATDHLWTLDLSVGKQGRWQPGPPLPAATRAFNMVATQHNGYHDCVYVIGGRREQNGTTEFLRDTWEFTPATNSWRQRTEAPREMMAGTAIGLGQSHVLVLGSASGANFDRVDELRDNHPGFPREAFAYHTITDSWTSAGETPLTQVTTTPVMWNGEIIVPTGEVRPRVRSPKVYGVRPFTIGESFGMINYGVLFAYLGGMVAVGLYFARRNKNTEQYFRGGQSIP